MRRVAAVHGGGAKEKPYGSGRRKSRDGEEEEEREPEDSVVAWVFVLLTLCVFLFRLVLIPSYEGEIL